MGSFPSCTQSNGAPGEWVYGVCQPKKRSVEIVARALSEKVEGSSPACIAAMSFFSGILLMLIIMMMYVGFMKMKASRERQSIAHVGRVYLDEKDEEAGKVVYRDIIRQ